MCEVKVKDIVPSREIREILGIDDIISTQQQTGFNVMGTSCKK